MNPGKILPYSNSNIELDSNEKELIIQQGTKAYEAFLDSLQIDWRNDPNSMDTPRRVAKSFVTDLISGCYSSPPEIRSFDNLDKYDGIVCQCDIEVKSICAHHHLSFIGKAHVAYIPGNKLIGLSKLNRIVEWYSRRPQTQENLTMQIVNHLNEVCEGNGGIAVMIECNHLCACVRGVKHDSTMRTAKLTGAFYDDEKARQEFYEFINRSK